MRTSLHAYSIIGGSVKGLHRGESNVSENNQDAFSWCRGRHTISAIVCDGCGSSPYSEVGAWIAAKLLAQSFMTYGDLYCDQTQKLDTHPEFYYWDHVTLSLKNAIESVVGNPGSKADKSIQDFFLFTIVGALITPIHTYVFSMGDGLFAVNGRLKTIGPFSMDDPPYLGYSLMTQQKLKRRLKMLSSSFIIHKKTKTNAVRNLIIGTDGLFELYTGKTSVRDSLCLTSESKIENFLRHQPVQSSAAKGLEDDATMIIIQK